MEILYLLTIELIPCRLFCKLTYQTISVFVPYEVRICVEEQYLGVFFSTQNGWVERLRILNVVRECGSKLTQFLGNIIILMCQTQESEVTLRCTTRWTELLYLLLLETVSTMVCSNLCRLVCNIA